MDRRTVFKMGAAALGVAATSSYSALAQNLMHVNHSMQTPNVGLDTIRVVFIGMGTRAAALFAFLKAIPYVEIVAVVDLEKHRIERLAKKVPIPASAKWFYGSSHSYKQALEIESDLAVVATTWETHASITIDALKAGLHVAVEVPACITLEEGEEMLAVARKTGKFFTMLENVCYGEEELTLLNMVDADYFGIVHTTEAAYIHDLRENLFDEERYYPKRWRADHHRRRNGNLYPTHGFGPISKYLSLMGTDNVTEVFSISSGSFALNELKGGGFKQGDFNTTIIRTENDKLINLYFSTTTPHKYDRRNAIFGTKGSFTGFPNELFLDPMPHEADDEKMKALFSRFRPKIWHDNGRLAKKMGGHGGIDFLMIFSLCQNLKMGLPMDISPEESILWSILAPLTEISVASGRPVSIPDYLKGVSGKAPVPSQWRPLEEVF